MTHGSVGEAKAAVGGVEITRGFGAALQTLGLSLKARGAAEELSAKRCLDLDLAWGVENWRNKASEAYRYGAMHLNRISSGGR